MLKGMTWEIVFYKISGGQPVVQKFIDDLPETARTRRARNIDLLEQYVKRKVLTMYTQ